MIKIEILATLHKSVKSSILRGAQILNSFLKEIYKNPSIKNKNAVKKNFST